MLGERLDTGFTAEIYAWGNDCVLKHFKKDFPEEKIHYEARVSQAVAQVGLAPKVMEVIRLDGRLGLICQRVFGVSMAEHLQKHPDEALPLARLFANLQSTMHRITNVPDIPQQNERLSRKILQAADLPSDLRDAVLQRLAALPQQNALCHGDFHPGNIMLTDKAPVIIDWMDVMLGHPLADVARTRLLLKGVRLWGEENIRKLIMPFEEAYLEHYLRLNACDLAEVNAWYPIVAAGRLSEGLHAYNAWLVDEVKKGLEG